MNSPHIAVPIHILDDDSLVNIFYLYRPIFIGEDGDDNERLHGGKQLWVQRRWWYRLAHVCQRWRNLILGSASYLRLSLVCTNGTPVANMLSHSPPLPLTVDYRSEDGITAEDEEGLLLALEQRHRVRHLRLLFPVEHLQKLVKAIDEEFPILEYMILEHSAKNSMALVQYHTPFTHSIFVTSLSAPKSRRTISLTDMLKSDQEEWSQEHDLRSGSRFG